MLICFKRSDLRVSTGRKQDSILDDIEKAVVHLQSAIVHSAPKAGYSQLQLAEVQQLFLCYQALLT